jgi:hydrogenase maturation protease
VNPERIAEGWRIIGVGSPVAGDDLGWAAIEALKDAGLDRVAELLLLDRPGPALVDHFQGRNRVILIDAMEAGLAPGSVRALALEELIVSAHPSSSHGLGLAEALALARALDCIPKHLHVIGIETGPSLDGETRSIAIRQVVQLIQAILNETDPGSDRSTRGGHPHRNEARDSAILPVDSTSDDTGSPMNDNDASAAELTKEQRILNMMRKVLTDVARDTHAPPGTKHALTERTITGIRDCLSLISAREQELAEALGDDRNLRPRYVDEPRKNTVVPINIDGLKKRPKSD